MCVLSHFCSFLGDISPPPSGGGGYYCRVGQGVFFIACTIGVLRFDGPPSPKTAQVNLFYGSLTLYSLNGQSRAE